MDRRGFRDNDVQVATTRLESLRDGEEHADAGTVEVGRAAEVDDVSVGASRTSCCSRTRAGLSAFDMSISPVIVAT